MADNNIIQPEKSLGELLRELRDDTAILIKQELRLASTELSQKATLVSKGVAVIAGGALAALIGLEFLLLALAVGLAMAWNQSMGEAAYWFGPFLVGLVVLIAGAFTAWSGYHTLRKRRLAPEKTLESMKETKQWLSQRTAH